MKIVNFFQREFLKKNHVSESWQRPKNIENNLIRTIFLEIWLLGDALEQLS